MSRSVNLLLASILSFGWVDRVVAAPRVPPTQDIVIAAEDEGAATKLSEEHSAVCAGKMAAVRVFDAASQSPDVQIGFVDKMYKVEDAELRSALTGKPGLKSVVWTCAGATAVLNIVYSQMVRPGDPPEFSYSKTFVRMGVDPATSPARKLSPVELLNLTSSYPR